MTIPVTLDQLASTLTAFDHAYVITLRGADEFVKVVTVDPVVRDDRLVITTGHRSILANVEADPRVTLVWPPREYHGFSLIVDGHGSVAGDELVVAIDHGILHRPHEHDDGPAWVFPTG